MSRDVSEAARERDRQRSAEWRARNPEKVKANNAAYHAANKERIQARHRERRDQTRFVERRRIYGLTEGQQRALAEAQGGVCAICASPPPDGAILHVDHDHACCPGRESCGNCVRGLICGTCNRHISAIERHGWLDAAMGYLNAPPAKSAIFCQDREAEGW